MNALVLYLLKSVVWLSGFSIIYLLFLRKERFFMLKRIYLIAGIIVSLIFPVITFHYKVELPAPVPQADVSQYIAIPVQETTDIPEKEFDYYYLLAGIYIAGVLVLLLRNLFHLVKLLNSIQKSKTRNIGNARLIMTQEYPSSFSFFNYVFVNPSVDEGEVKEIVIHELVHVKQRHWVDLLLGEILRILQWANPFAWIYTGFIRLNHEFMADKEALQQTSDPAVYKAVLLNQFFKAPVISLTNSFNYSITKTRFEMMKKTYSSPYRKLKVLAVLPLVTIVFYAFAAPKYHYPADVSNKTETFPIYASSPIIQQKVAGIVSNEEGKPLPGVSVMSTGTMGKAFVMQTDNNGRFEIQDVQKDASIMFSLKGYKQKTVKPDFSGVMEIRLEKDPAFTETPPPIQRPQLLVVVDGTVTDKKIEEVRKELGHNYGPMKLIPPKEATEKYGEKGINGAYEITTRKKALEMGLPAPYPRIAPEDYPTFMGQRYFEFNNWVFSHVQYPEEAKSKGYEGWVFVNFIVQPDGSITDIKPTGDANTLLQEEVAKAIKSAPKFEPAKNPESNEPLQSSVTLKFALPDKVLNEAPWVVVEEMPMFPGGDAALLKFIAENTVYPESMKAAKIGGRVIVRFIVTPEGNAEGISILKGVNPELDKEAVNVVKKLKGFKPGTQGGKAVPVWYMVPITFTLEQPDNLLQRSEGNGSSFSNESAVKILKFIGENTTYPAMARNSSTEGKVYVKVKMEKGGIVRECKAAKVRDGITVPFLQEVVIVGYKSDRNQNPDALRSNKEVQVPDGARESLEKEALRVANLLGKVNAPEWQDKDMEFAIQLNFTLR